MFKELYKFFDVNDLLSSSQSGFQPSASCINQLPSITQKIYRSFNNDFEVREVLLTYEMSVKVSHEQLFLKLSRNGISRILLNVLRDFKCFKRFKGFF